MTTTRLEDDLHHRGHRPGRQPRGRGGPAARATASAPWSAPRATPAGSTSWGVEKVVGDLEDRRGPPPGRRRGRLGLQLRRQGRRLGHPGGIPPAQRRGLPAPARRRRRRAGRAVRPRQLARRLRGPRPLRHRRDGPPGRRLARRLHPVEGRGRGTWPCDYVAGARAARWRSSGPASSTARATGRSCPSCCIASGTGRFAYFGSGDQALNCIYVKNLVHGIFLAAEVPAAVGEVFNLTDGGRSPRRSSSAASPSWRA